MRLERPLLFFDLETTGVDVENDRIIEFASIKVFPDRSKNKFETLINPERVVPPEVTELTGIRDEDVLTAPVFADVADDIAELVRDADLAGFNAIKFDLPLLQREFERLDRPFPGPPGQAVVDAFEIVRHFEPRTLSWTLKYYLDRELPDAHRAMVDVVATEDIMREQILRYKLQGTPGEIAARLRHPYLDSGRRLRAEGEHVIICFGRYKGSTLKDITERDPSYLLWMNENMDREVVEILKQYVHFEKPGHETVTDPPIR